MATARRPIPLTSSERAKAHLARLKKAKGHRLLVDLDAQAMAALNTLLAGGYGATKKAVVQRALVAASNRIKPPKPKP